eukprot:scaffold248535_cov74-Cyclotella_meneghiniana.AAC.1
MNDVVSWPGRDSRPGGSIRASDAWSVRAQQRRTKAQQGTTMAQHEAQQGLSLSLSCIAGGRFTCNLFLPGPRDPLHSDLL